MENLLNFRPAKKQALKYITVFYFSTYMAAALACMVAEFKMITHTSNDPRIRQEAAKNWLLTKGAGCSEAQLKIIQSSAPTWLGTSLSTELSIIVDGLQEKKIGKDSAKLMGYYMPAIKTFTPTVETTVNPKAPAPVVQPSDAGNPVVGGVVAVNNSFNRENDDESKDIKNARFSKKDRLTASKFFDELRGDKECPPFMKPQGEMCTTVRPNRTWKRGEPLGDQSTVADVPLKLQERLGPAPRHHKYIQIDEDILLINEKTNVVADMILDLGGVPVKPRPTPPVPPKK